MSKNKVKKYGTMTGKVLGMLASGFVLSLTKDKKQRFELYEECDRLWMEIDRKELYHVLRRLKMNGFVETIKKSNKIEEIRLNQKGKAKFLEYQFRNLELKTKKKWDRKWRMVLFDIPETRKHARDSLRNKLKKLGFLEFQKSVFIYPFNCENEINFVINFLGVEEYVYCLKSSISPDTSFQKHFGVQ